MSNKDEIRDWLQQLAGESVCESPIEGMLASALMYEIAFDMFERSYPADAVLPMVRIDFQHKCESYRIDMVLVGSDGGAKIAIECDGHEFHEKTKEQAQRDKARDRALAAAGWRVLRFTGSEIWKNPFACANEAMSVVHQMESKAAEVRYQAAKDRPA